MLFSSTLCKLHLSLFEYLAMIYVRLDASTTFHRFKGFPYCDWRLESTPFWAIVCDASKFSNSHIVLAVYILTSYNIGQLDGHVFRSICFVFLLFWCVLSNSVFISELSVLSVFISLRHFVLHIVYTKLVDMIVLHKRECDVCEPIPSDLLLVEAFLVL